MTNGPLAVNSRNAFIYLFLSSPGGTSKGSLGRARYPIRYYDGHGFFRLGSDHRHGRKQAGIVA